MNFLSSTESQSNKMQTQNLSPPLYDQSTCDCNAAKGDSYLFFDTLPLCLSNRALYTYEDDTNDLTLAASGGESMLIHQSKTFISLKCDISLL